LFGADEPQAAAALLRIKAPRDLVEVALQSHIAVDRERTECFGRLRRERII
jgi:hypothetical protein